MIGLLQRRGLRDAPAPVAPGIVLPTWLHPGLAPMTRVRTTMGDVYAQTLRVRDEVQALDGAAHEIVTVDRMTLDEGFLADVPDAHAVRIRAGALGSGLPHADITVSPAQPIGAGQSVSELAFRAARDFLDRPGIERVPEEMITYTTFRCAMPVVIQIEGVWSKISG